MKRSLTQKLGLLGVVSFLSYTAAVVFAPLTYPGYNWMAQAVSDLSAANAPSLALWNQLSALYNACEVVCATVVCIGIQGQKTKLLRSGIYLFAIMEWISAVGYRMFPLSSNGYAGAFQDVMHMVTTALVVLLSIVSLTMIIVAGAKSKNCRSYGVCAAVALAMMLVGAMGMKIVPAEYFGVVERFSVFAATGFNAALGIHLFCMKAQPLVFHELLCFCSDALCVECCCAGRLVRAEMKICHQLPRRIIGRKLKQLAHKVDHIPVFPAGKTIIMIVRHIQAGVPVVVKGAEGHAIMVDLHAVPLRCLPAAYAVFYNFKKIHCSSISAQKTAACPLRGKPPFASYLMLFSLLPRS